MEFLSSTVSYVVILRQIDQAIVTKKSQFCHGTMAEALVRKKRTYASYAFHPTNKLIYAAFKPRPFPNGSSILLMTSSASSRATSIFTS